MDETALRRPENDVPAPAPSRAWRRTSLAVPPLVVIAFVLFGVFIPMSNGHTDRSSSECRWLPLPWDFWAVAYGGLAAALAAVALQIGLRRYARARGWYVRSSWQAGLASGFAVVGGLAVLLTGVAVFVANSQAADYNAHHDEPICEGLAVPGR